MKKKLQGQYLKEIGISFVSSKKLTSKKVRIFVQDIVGDLGLEIVSSTVNELAPGFDVLTTIKESFVYFGYWGETKYCRLIVSSCKEFSTLKLMDRVDYYFPYEGKVLFNSHKDITIKEEVKKCLK